MNRILFLTALASLLAAGARAQKGGLTESDGKVAAVAGGNISVVLNDGTNMGFSASDLAKGAAITLGGAPKRLSDIAVGSGLAIFFGPDMAIDRIDIYAPGTMPATAAPAKPAAPAVDSYVGKITKLDGGRIDLMLKTGPSGDWTIAPDALSASGAKLGDVVSVDVSPQGAVSRLAVLRGRDVPAPPAGQWNQPSINGKVRWWTGVVLERGSSGSGDAMTRMFVLHRKDWFDTMSFAPDAATRYYVVAPKGKPVKAAFDDVVLGVVVSAAVQDGKVLEAVVRQ